MGRSVIIDTYLPRAEWACVVAIARFRGAARSWSRLSRDRAGPVTCTHRPDPEMFRAAGGLGEDGTTSTRPQIERSSDGRHLGSVRPASIIIILGFLSIVTSQLGIIQLSCFKEKPLWRFQVLMRRIDYRPVIKNFLVI